MRWLVLAVLVFGLVGCDVDVHDDTPDVKIIEPDRKPLDVEVKTPKVDVDIKRD